MSAQAKGKAKEKPIASLLAGATAGGVEAFITFPLESVKTQLQFGALDGGKPLTPYQALKSTIQQRGVHGLYAGCTAVVIGNAVKAGVRFTTYDQFKSLLKDDEGKLTAPRSMLAGLGAGMSEAIIAVTPSETIKQVYSPDYFSFPI
ncbi:solute carrier family 25 (mitochondrial citrate transporter), member 1, partial [Cryptococcus neoformans MW-RSA852]